MVLLWKYEKKYNLTLPWDVGRLAFAFCRGVERQLNWLLKDKVYLNWISLDTYLEAKFYCSSAVWFGTVSCALSFLVNGFMVSTFRLLFWWICACWTRIFSLCNLASLIYFFIWVIAILLYFCLGLTSFKSLLHLGFSIKSPLNFLGILGT